MSEVRRGLDKLR